ncbi:MAG: hypothetical protein ACTHU0_23325 [Kofleriaceae bacterium]
MPPRLRLLVVLALCALSAPAHADLVDQVVGWQQIPRAKVREVWGYAMPAGSEITHVLIARHVRPGTTDRIDTSVGLLRCDDHQCTGRSAPISSGDDVEVLGLIDLEGAPGPLPTSSLPRERNVYHTLSASPHARWPALVLRHGRVERATTTSRRGGKVTGTYEHSRITVISLDPRGDQIVFAEDTERRDPTGAGFTRTVRLARRVGNGPLDLIVREQRHLERTSRCLRPEPTETTWRLDDRRYAAKGLPERRGC